MTETNVYRIYESEKQKIIKVARSPEEYERTIRVVAERIGI